MNRRDRDNLIRWDAVSRGCYEVWYLKFNLARQGLAFWMRYTLSAPRAGLGDPVFELWAIVTSSQPGGPRFARKETFTRNRGAFRRDRFEVRVGDALLNSAGCRGALGGDDGFSWDIQFRDEGTPWKHFSNPALYLLPLPKTKVCAPNLAMRVFGDVTIGGEKIRVVDAPGHQAHIWGTQHALRWAWANCTDFDGAPGTVLEMLTARVALGSSGRESPPMTIALLRTPRRDYAFNDLSLSFTNKARYDLDRCDVLAISPTHRLKATILNRVDDMIGVTYHDPDGSTRVCNNSKLSDASVQLEKRTLWGWRAVHTLTCRGRAAYEVVGANPDPRVPVLIP